MNYYRPMMQLPHAVASCALVVMVCSAAAQIHAPDAPSPTAEAAKAPAPEQSRLTGRLFYELLVSEMAFRQGDAQAAGSLMLNAARRSGDESLFKRAAEMAIQSRSGPAALEVTRAWRDAKPKSTDAGQYELQVLIVLGRIAETEEPLRRFVASLPAGDKVALITALPSLYQRVPDKAEAARVVEKGLDEAIKSADLAPAAWTTIGRMRLQAGDKAGALAAATLGQSADTLSEWPALLALQLMAADEPKAEPMVRRYLSSAGAKPEVRIGYARALVDQSRNADAHAELNRLIQQQPGNADGWLVQGALYADERQDAKAETALRRYLELASQQNDAPGADRGPGRDQARMMLARIAERRGDVASAEKLLAEVESADQALTVQIRRATLMARQGQMEQARQAIRSTPERGPEDVRLKLLAEAQLLRDHGQAQIAYAMLQAELAKDPDDESLLYDTAMAAEKAGHVDEMERLLRRLIKLKPDSAQAHNALGYSLADRGVRLAEAKQLIEKAVQLVPEDAYIQDSLAWVEFRMGRPRESRRILEAAYKTRPDAEIAAHLGEVLWSLGERDAARRIWREGVQLDPENETLIKTLKRFQVTP